MLQGYSEHPAGPVGDLGTHGRGKGGPDLGRGARQAEGPYLRSGNPQMHAGL